MNVGDYVRTKDGIILKIKDIEDIYTTDNEYIGMAIYDNKGHFVNNVEIIKSSPNIIDLIEVGDYVNGRKIDFIDKDGVYSDYNNAEYYYIEKNDIETVLTHEQFESEAYRVEE